MSTVLLPALFPERKREKLVIICTLEETMLALLTVIRGKFPLNFLLIIILIFASNFQVTQICPSISSLIAKSLLDCLCLMNPNIISCLAFCVFLEIRKYKHIYYTQKKSSLIQDFEHCYTFE